jgi:hypothetical protein
MATSALLCLRWDQIAGARQGRTGSAEKLWRCARAKQALASSPARGPGQDQEDYSLRGRQLEDKRDAGTARAGERAHLVRGPPRYPKAVTGQFRKRIKRGRGIPGCDQVAVVDLAVQRSRRLPDTQPPLPAAMADHISCQLVHGQDHFPGPFIRQSRPTGQNQHFSSQNVQRDRAEHKVKEQRDAIRRNFFYPAVIDH